MLQPMLASLDEAPLTDPQLVYEPKYDGVRIIAEVARSGARVRLWSRLGNEKTTQFAEIAKALEQWGRPLVNEVVLDGEVVALDAAGRPTGFQKLQGRIHVTQDTAAVGATPLAFMAFDVLKADGHDLRERPLHERRRVLERLMASVRRPSRAKRRGRESADTRATGRRAHTIDAGTLRVSEQVKGDGRELYTRAIASGWEGLIAKHVDSRYRSGKRSADWRKLKIVHEQEFVIGGWTEPRQARSYFGALLLGVYEGDALRYVGHTGTGFDQQELERLMRLFGPRARVDCPFTPPPKTNERPHWVSPDLVVQVKFAEWTGDGKLRHPVYLGLRDDKSPRDVHREGGRRLHATSRERLDATGTGALPTPRTARRNTASVVASNASGGLQPANLDALVHALQDLEDARRDGTLDLGDGQTIAVTNLHKPFWPQLKLTKGDLFRFYVRAAPYLLPAIADRPLVMKRLPNGIEGKPFYQHRAPTVPAGVRVQPVPGAEGGRPHIIGGDLMTLIYTTQLAAISQDPWFSRVQSPTDADFVALDLDPSDDVSFRQVLDVARAIRDELGSMKALGVPKTSGASGLHIYIPLPPGTPYEAGLLFCQIIATVVANKHPRIATTERTVRARGKRVYVDYLQNIVGKTLASAYSARASEYAGVSTPVTWEEVEAGFDREAFTIRTVPERLGKVGDLWAALRRSKGADLSKAARYGV